MKINNLTATQVKALKYKGKGNFTAHSVDSTCKLYLLCYESGAKIFKFRKRNSTYITIDDYDYITLAEARQKASELYRQELKGELDTGNMQISVKELFLKWLDTVKIPKVDENQGGYLKYVEKRRKFINRVNKWLLVPFGNMPIQNFNKKELIAQTTQKEQMSYTTALKVLPTIRDFLKYAKAGGFIDSYAFILEIIDDMKALYPKTPTQHRKAPNDELRLRQIMQEVKRSNLSATIKNLFFLSLIMGQRPHQFRELEWNRVDLEAGFLYFNESDNKTGLSRVRIPLPRQAIEILQAQKGAYDTNSDLVFQSSIFSPKSRWQLSQGTLMHNIRSLGIDDLHAHGFRSILSTFAIRASEKIDGVERAKFEKRIIDEVTLHTRGSEVDKAYFRDFNSKEHLRLLQWWADYLDGLEKIEAYKER